MAHHCPMVFSQHHCNSQISRTICRHSPVCSRDLDAFSPLLSLLAHESGLSPPGARSYANPTLHPQPHGHASFGSHNSASWNSSCITIGSDCYSNCCQQRKMGKAETKPSLSIVGSLRAVLSLLAAGRINQGPQ